MTETHIRMFDVGGRDVTSRRAVAEGILTAPPDVVRAVVERRLAKGDALALAEVAGILAVKQVPLVIPLCHNIPIDKASVTCRADAERGTIVVRGEVSCTARTGVEIEAIAAVQAALLCIYDLTKSLSPLVRFDSVRLVEKSGGKNGYWSEQEGYRATPTVSLRVGIITVSDRSSRGERADASGPALTEACEKRGWNTSAVVVVPDDVDAIQGAVLRHVADAHEVVILTGGTGIGPRDRTPEALASIMRCTVPGFGELARLDGAKQTNRSWLSRGGAVMVGKTLVVMTPGSPRGARHTLASLGELIEHAVAMARGDDHEDHGGTHAHHHHHDHHHAKEGPR